MHWAPRSDLESRYLRTLPDAIPRGSVLVHSSVRPTLRKGRAARYWLQAPDPGRLGICLCGWAPDLGLHYRVRGAPWT